MKQPFYRLSLLFLFCGSLSVNLWAQPACLGTQGQLKWLLWENERDDELDYLTHLHSFPNNPDTYEPISGLKSIGTVYEADIEGVMYEGAYYGTYYGSMIRGYLAVPSTGNYTFNLTGDDEVKFLLSTDHTRSNLVEQSSVIEWTYRKEHAKATELNQTSTPVNLTVGTYYYFEVWHKEHSGGDHFEVLWKTPANEPEWQDIPDTLLYNYACSCPLSGTACDDGNAATINDKEDGFCNCVGTPNNAPACVGKQGEIKAMYFTEISGNSMSSFLEADKYPLMPDTFEILELLKGPLINRDTYGTKIAGMLRVPITGDYQFSVTASDRASFAISTDTTSDNLVEVSYSNWSSEHNQYDELTQIQTPVTLNKDNFYYFEVHHREGTGSDRFSVFWRTPFTQDTLWRYIDKAYVYGYACEMACFPEGTACDDNNNFTKNDKFDADCNCLGEPCRGAECDETPALTYTPTESCGVSDDLDNAPVDAWESCTQKNHPTSGRGLSHWIQYDLGKIYLLNGTHIWNYNGEGTTGKGFKDVVIDYSSDGINWTQLGSIYQWEQASGLVGYKGFEGPNFNGITAQYILITALNNWNDNGLCTGFSKITIDATECLMMGQACDDGDPNSVNERYDAYCNCIGEGVGYSQDPCGESDLIQANIVLTEREYRSSARIESQGMVNAGGDVKLIAGESVTLMIGFHAQAGCDFLATIGACEEVFTLQNEEEILDFSKVNESTNALSESNEMELNPVSTFAIEDLGTTKLDVWPNPTNNWTSFYFNLPSATLASLCVYTTDGKKITCLASNNAFSEGIYIKEFPAQRLAAGMYYVVLKTEAEVLTKPLVVIE